MFYQENIQLLDTSANKGASSAVVFYSSLSHVLVQSLPGQMYHMVTGDQAYSKFTPRRRRHSCSLASLRREVLQARLAMHRYTAYRVRAPPAFRSTATRQHATTD